MKDLSDFLPEKLRGKYSIVDQNLDPIKSSSPLVVLNTFGQVNITELTEERIQSLIKRGCPFIKTVKEISKIKKTE